MQEYKKIHGSGTTTLIISNEEMNDIIKIVQALEDSNILSHYNNKKWNKMPHSYAPYVMNLDEYEDAGTHWIALFCKKIKLFILIASVLSIFLKKLKNLLEIKT